MEPFEITDMIIDDGFDTQETVTAGFSLDRKNYSVTFNKADLEIINSWLFAEETSVPANLSDEVIEALRKNIKEHI